MASIYDKALKRKDFSGIVDKDAVAMKALAADDARGLHSHSISHSQSTTATGGANDAGNGGNGNGNGHGGAGGGAAKMSKEERKKAEDKRDESKAGADVGKIVNLMAGGRESGGFFFFFVCRFFVLWRVVMWLGVGLESFCGFVGFGGASCAVERLMEGRKFALCSV